MITLDPQQEAAARTNAHRAAIVSTAGSGKTRTLAARFKYLTEECGVLSSQILVLTFSRAAAYEMKERIGESAGNATISTFHAYALKLLQGYGHVLGWEYDWLTILDQEETEKEQRDALQEVGLMDRMGKWKRIKKHEWEQFANGICDGDRTPDDGSPMSTAWNRYEQRLKAANTVTFGTLLLEAVKLINHPEVGPEIRGMYDHCCVDETQDSNKINWDMLHAMQFTNLWVVGDPAQAIYGFRGGRPDLFVEFSQQSETHKLLKSYRFGYQIAETAMNVILHNPEGVGLAIETIATNHSSIKVLNAVEFDQIASLIKIEHSQGEAWKDIAVLARTHKVLDELHDQLKSAGIPSTHVGSKTSVPKSSEYRIIRGYVRLAVNPESRHAFMAAAAGEGLTADQLLEIRRKANNEGISLREAYGKPMPATMAEMETMLSATDPGGDYRQAFRFVNEIAEREVVLDMKELSHALMLWSVDDEMAQVGEEVVLSTCHSSKGREWPVVIIVGLDADTFPSKQSWKENKVDEETRLLFVAITRARKRLYFASSPPEQDDVGESIFIDWITKKEGEV